MPTEHRPKVRVVALDGQPESASNDGQGRQARVQRGAVIVLGCLWFAAFASSCSRSSKNCSAYDGVRMELQKPVETGQN